MKTLPANGPAGYRRHIRYVDETLQKVFLIGLVLLEAVLAIGLAWLMYQRLNQIIDDNMYRVHLADAVPMLSQLMHEALVLLAIFLAVNVLALVLVDFVWARYVHAILRLFMQLMEKTRRLNFSVDSTISERHQVLDLAKTQREQDRARLTQIRQQVAALALAVQENKALPDAQAQVKAISELLPQAVHPTQHTRRATD